MSDTSQRRAIKNYRNRLVERGMARFEVLGRGRPSAKASPVTCREKVASSKRSGARLWSAPTPCQPVPSS